MTNSGRRWTLAVGVGLLLGFTGTNSAQAVDAYIPPLPTTISPQANFSCAAAATVEYREIVGAARTQKRAAIEVARDRWRQATAVELGELARRLDAASTSTERGLAITEFKATTTPQRLIRQKTKRDAIQRLKQAKQAAKQARHTSC